MSTLRAGASGCLLFFILVLCSATSAWAVSSDSPEVKAAIEKALKYLEKADHEHVGGKCLIALAFKKNGREKTHPKIKEAVDACYGHKLGPTECDNYNLGLMIIFLCEMEEERHRPLVQKMLTELLKRQKPHGGWGYDGYATGDTSQTQYAVLAIWITDRQRYDIPLNNIAAAMNWLIRTQDPKGGWGYQGVDPSGGNRVEQSPVTMSLTAAACSSLYILHDLVVVPGAVAGVKQVKTPGLLEVEQPGQQKVLRRPITGVDGAALTRAQNDGKAWLAKNFTVEPSDWAHYAFYAYERFASFQEKADNTDLDETKWFNDLFKRLSTTQKKEGDWDGQDQNSVATAFSVLVLSRSTKKAIARVAEVLGEGVMLGGLGLPLDTKDLVERNGKIVENNKGAGNIEQLLALIEDDNSDSAELLRKAESNEAIVLDTDLTRREGQITKLRATVSAGSAEARILAVRTLGRDNKTLNNVPVLLFALGDSDPRVVREADLGLRFISRKFDGVVSCEVIDRATQLNLRKGWRAWFVSIKPDAELLD